MLNRYGALFTKALSKPARIVCFKALQELKLKWMGATGAWQRFSSKTAQNFAVISTGIEPLLLVSERPVLSGVQRNQLKSLAHNVRTSNFSLLGNPVPELTSCNFNTDWRYGKEWQPQYYKKYNFYEQKSEPYDVKFPWELSRLHYLVPVLACQWYEGGDSETLIWIYQLLYRWRDENPLAYSVNWYAMEASMRIVNLAMMLDFVSLLAREAANDLSNELGRLEKLLIIMLKEHGYFVWHNREFTDIRGNHFTANITALFLAAVTLERRDYRQKKWLDYSLRWLDKEILLQFLPDGVNFEKSCGYHKLVLELFLISAIARERYGVPFSEEATERLVAAAKFSDALTGPDNLVANFGDNDDAVALPLNFNNARSHGAVVELARSFFDANIGTVMFKEEERLSSLFLLGKCRTTLVAQNTHELLYFPAGGYAIVRNQAKGFFFIVDIGEVGMRGKGGHGHNDLLSFELFIDGEPIVIDPGCSGYTSDLDKKSLYRSTANHSTVQVFGEEIARFGGHWMISNDAVPIEVSVFKDLEKITIRAGHNGYNRIASGSTVFRQFDINPSLQEVLICDEISVPVDDTSIQWNFPIGKQVIAQQSANELLLGVKSSVRISSDLPLALNESFYSCGYGQEEIGRTISISTSALAGKHLYHFNLSKTKG
ncbi:MAG: alginate lyase family protein [Desulfuromonadaceae bacterium]|nr:alginate lyase family protein [Desulfuromonadaceae bacterium]MDD2854370.1 alginate lyase family protein [Desulfuromonadaceae bacterium]